jgi:hypothetical protein
MHVQVCQEITGEEEQLGKKSASAPFAPGLADTINDHETFQYYCSYSFQACRGG